MSQDCIHRRPLAAVGSCNNVVQSSRNSSKRPNSGPSIDPHYLYAKHRKDCTLENVPPTSDENLKDENRFPQYQSVCSKITESKNVIIDLLKYNNSFPLYPPASHTPPPPTQHVTLQNLESNTIRNSLPVWEVMRIDDRTALYTKNFGIDNQHNNYWAAFSFEQAAVKVDSIHPGPYFVNFTRLCDYQRLWICHCLGLLSDKLHSKHSGRSYCLCVGASPESRYAFCTRATAVFGIACHIFDRFMEIVKRYDEKRDLKPKEHILFPFNNKTMYRSSSGVLTLNYIIALSCYYLADRHEAVRAIDYQSLIEAWQEIVQSNKFKLCNPAAFQAEELHEIQQKILQVLKCYVSNPTASMLVEELLNPRSANSQNPAGFGGNKFSARSAEGQLLVRLATIYPKIGLVFLPSIQAAAAAQLASELNPPFIWNDDILQDYNGEIRKISIERCKYLMMSVFVKLYNGGLNTSENFNPNDRIWQYLEVDIAKWMFSLNLGDENVGFLRRIMERYQNYIKTQALQPKLKRIL